MFNKISDCFKNFEQRIQKQQESSNISICENFERNLYFIGNNIAIMEFAHFPVFLKKLRGGGLVKQGQK